jgi:precorrin-6B methylase 1
MKKEIKGTAAQLRQMRELQSNGFAVLKESQEKKFRELLNANDVDYETVCKMNGDVIFLDLERIKEKERA